MGKGKKKPLPVPVPQPVPEESDSSSGSDEEEEDQQIQHTEFLHNAQKSDSEEEEEEGGGEEDDNDDSTSAEESEDEGEAEKKGPNEASSDSSSGSEGTPTDRFVVIPRKPEERLKHQKTPKKAVISESTASKRARNGEPEESASSKKAKKEAKQENQTPKQKANHTEKSTQRDFLSSSNDKKSAKKSEQAKADNSQGKNGTVSSLPENGSSKKSGKQEKAALDKRISKIQESESKKTLSPSKPKLWTPKDEITFSTELLKELEHLSELPENKSDAFWANMIHKLEGKCKGSWTGEQLCDKMKRMRTRYTGMAEKVENSSNYKFRTTSDRTLYTIWHQIWGNSEHQHGESQGKQQTNVTHPPTTTKDDKNQRSNTGNATPGNGETSKPSDSESDESESDESESDDSDDEAESEENNEPVEEVKKKEPSKKDKNVAEEAVPIVAAVPLCSFADTQKLLQGEIKSSVAAFTQSSKQMFSELLTKTMGVVENSLKDALGHGKPISGLCNANMPLSMDIQIPQGENAFQQQWFELQLQELELYKKKLELLQKECTWKQEHLKSQIKSSK